MLAEFEKQLSQMRGFGLQRKAQLKMIDSTAVQLGKPRQFGYLSIVNLRLLTAAALSLVAWNAKAGETARANEFAGYLHKMQAYHQDLVETGRRLLGLDVVINKELINVANEYVVTLNYIQDLLLIESTVEDDNDRRKVRAIISRSFTSTAQGIETSIEVTNLEISDSHNQNIVATATKLRDDLRGLKALLDKTAADLDQTGR